MSIFEALLNCDLTPEEEVNTFMNIVDSTIDAFTCENEVFESTHTIDIEDFASTYQVCDLGSIEANIEYRAEGGSLKQALTFLVKEINSLWAGIVADFAHLDDLYVFTLKLGEYKDSRVFNVVL